MTAARDPNVGTCDRCGWGLTIGAQCRQWIGDPSELGAGAVCDGTGVTAARDPVKEMRELVDACRGSLGAIPGRDGAEMRVPIFLCVALLARLADAERDRDAARGAADKSDTWARAALTTKIAELEAEVSHLRLGFELVDAEREGVLAALAKAGATTQAGSVAAGVDLLIAEVARLTEENGVTGGALADAEDEVARWKAGLSVVCRTCKGESGWWSAPDEGDEPGGETDGYGNRWSDCETCKGTGAVLAAGEGGG